MKFIDYKENIPRGREDFPFEFYHISHMHTQYHMPYHWHDELEMLHVLEGELHLNLDGEEFTGTAGDIFIVNTGVFHGGEALDCVYDCIVFDFHKFFKSSKIMQKYLTSYLNNEVRFHIRIPKEDSVGQGLLLRFFSAFTSGIPTFELDVTGILYLIVSHFVHMGYYHSTTPGEIISHQKSGTLKQVIQFIEHNYDQQLTLSDLASEAGMSPKYFCRYFHAMTNRTPMNYLNYYRIEMACVLLTTTTHSITEIAFDCGFNDLNYFIRCFKKYKGISPKKYAKEYFRIEQHGPIVH